MPDKQTVEQIAEKWAAVNWVPQPISRTGLRNILSAAINSGNNTMTEGK